MAAAQPEQVLAERDDAYVSTAGETWSIGGAGVHYTVGFDAGRLVVRELRVPGGVSLRPSQQRDGVFRLDGTDYSLTRSETRGFRFLGAASGVTETGVQLRLQFEHPLAGVRATRVYSVHAGAPAIEVWTELQASAPQTVVVSELVPLQLVVDGTGLTWIRGLDVPAELGGPFTVERRTIAHGDRVELEAPHRSTQLALPMVSLRGERATFFTGLLWSGRWRIDLLGHPGGRTQATLSIGDTETRLSASRPVELPHAVVGVVEGDESGVAPALQRFVVNGLRKGRPFEPQVTHNTWFVTGTRIDAASIEDAMRAAAEAGSEIFEIDAGWYEGAGEEDAFDFSSGLGSFRVDRGRFRDGLRPLGDLARSLGMRFGVWVEPERVDLRTVGRPGMVEESWLAQEDGAYQPGVPNSEARTALLDFGHPAARAWVVERLTTLIEEEGVDYLKWDNNYWVNNTRRQPGRGPHDGNFAHVSGLYQVLAELKARFPWLAIENCAGGGNRLDLGLMRYTDVGWMDDRTAPASRVRHNLQGLATFLPPAYLLSYLIAHGDEALSSEADLRLFARSRMPGVFGLSYGPAQLDERTMERLREETELWKSLRSLQAEASAIVLTDQAAGPNSPPWDVLLLLSSSRAEGVIYAYQTDREVPAVLVRLRGLDREATYGVESLRTRDVRVASGAQLMDAGLEIAQAEDTGSQILRLTRVPETETSPMRRTDNGR